MGSQFGKQDVIYPASFEVLGDARPDDASIPAFMVSTTRGFLPRMNPIVALPSEFDVVEEMLQKMPVKKANGEAGFLANGKLGDVVVSDLPDLTEHVDKYKDNLPLMNALYRDYSFLASAYLLEPCHQRFLKGEGYGLGRQVLPANIARPIARCAELCEFKPFMEYAGSYALFNFRLDDPSKGLDYSNLRLIRAFEHGLDPTSSEAGFVLVHVDMVKNSGPLVKGTVGSLAACQHQQAIPKGDVQQTQHNRSLLNDNLRTILSSLTQINGSMEKMWGKSKPGAYTSFRTFIFGITSQSMFPNGVVYEGVGDDGEPKSFRGESGANDSMIPLMDNLLQIPMPDTPLTRILEDFRSYRPSNHRQFLAWVRGQSEALGLKEWALGLAGHEDDVTESRQLWLKMLNQVRDFRWRHWCFAREYILKQTKHPTATGGSPIVTWLPNQLQAVMEEMVHLYGELTKSGSSLGEEVEDIMDLVTRQRETLRKEVAKFCEERGVAAAVAA